MSKFDLQIFTIQSRLNTRLQQMSLLLTSRKSQRFLQQICAWPCLTLLPSSKQCRCNNLLCKCTQFPLSKIIQAVMRKAATARNGLSQSLAQVAAMTMKTVRMGTERSRREGQRMTCRGETIGATIAIRLTSLTQLFTLT